MRQGAAAHTTKSYRRRAPVIVDHQGTGGSIAGRSSLGWNLDAQDGATPGCAGVGGFRRLRIRYERSSEWFYALVLLACGVICFNTLQQPPW
jgi:hypothetical protein